MYIDRPIKDYLDDLSARKPAPGGGSAAALAASIGVSLMSMVANYTIGNPKYKDAERTIADMLLKIDKYNGELQAIIDKDVEAYSKLSKGMKEHAKDQAKLDELYKEALDPPFEICKITAECLKLCDKLADCGNKNLITDTAIAAIMLEGAYFSAKYNVYINLKYIKDMDFIGKVHGTLSPLEEEMPRLKEEILEKCEDVIEK
jgi:formiminotetrahydrofolate cyclodeaminase